MRYGVSTFLVATAVGLAFLGGLVLLGSGRSGATTRARHSRQEPAIPAPTRSEDQDPLDGHDPEGGMSSTDALRDRSRRSEASPESLEDPLRMREWLLGIPEAELSRMAGSAELDRYVRIAISTPPPENPDDLEKPGEAPDFLRQLNERLRATAQGAKK